jgi:hypothetical protein
MADNDPNKKSVLLQDLVDVGRSTDDLRNIVLACVCEYHDILDYEKYLNSEAVIRYVYGRWDKEDECYVELYARKEYEEDRNPNKCLITPKCVMYSLAYTLITPAHVIQERILAKYDAYPKQYYAVHKKF